MSDGITDTRGGNDAPKIGVFSRDGGLRLEPATNGGWIVHTIPDRPGTMSDILGAYSTAAEMLDALKFALIK